MKLNRKHFQITDKKAQFIEDKLVRRGERIPKWSESDIVREALDITKLSKREINSLLRIY
ncbi:MAG TPA: hypothetical protein DDW50_22180 [Firmicutes bacterium]|jgi:hypothetical protein|nr:hypothetical protein [Bacillota bacterium]